MPAAIKILLDVAVFRLRRLEMANIAAALAIAVACHASALEIGYRGAFALLLNLLVYLNNDWYDLDDDLASAAKDQRKNAFLAANLGAGLRAQIGLVVVLAVMAWGFGGGLWLPLVAGGGVCWAYSAGLKRIPICDVLAMIAWGVAMPLCGLPPGHPEGWLLLGQLGLFSGVFESIQILRDHDADGEAGVRTTAVLLGPRRTLILARTLMVAAGVYAGLMFAWWLALAPALAALLPLRTDAVDRYWNQVRVLLGVTMLVETALVYLGGLV